MSDPWERRPGELARAYEAFRIYRDVGPTRKVEPMAETFGVATKTVTRWSSQYHWLERAAAWDAEVHRIEDHTRLEAIREMHQLHQRVAGVTIQRALAALAALPLEHIPAGAAARLLELGVRIQRQTLTTTPEELFGEMAGGAKIEDPWDRLVRELTSAPDHDSQPLVG
jgi:hypothetical protein